MRNLTVQAITWLNHRRARIKADDRGAFQTAEALALGAIAVLALIVVVQPRLTDILNSLLDTIQNSLPG